MPINLKNADKSEELGDEIAGADVDSGVIKADTGNLEGKTQPCRNESP